MVPAYRRPATKRITGRAPATKRISGAKQPALGCAAQEHATRCIVSFKRPFARHRAMTSERRERVERVRSVARSVLAVSLVTFFVSVVLLGTGIGEPLFVEGVASYSSLAVALSGFACLALGLSGARRVRDSLR